MASSFAFRPVFARFACTQSFGLPARSAGQRTRKKQSSRQSILPVFMEGNDNERLARRRTCSIHALRQIFALSAPYWATATPENLGAGLLGPTNDGRRRVQFRES